MKSSDKEVLDRIAKADKAKLAEWERKLREAQGQVEHWKKQVEHSSALAIRATVESWTNTEETH